MVYVLVKRDTDATVKTEIDTGMLLNVIEYSDNLLLGM